MEIERGKRIDTAGLPPDITNSVPGEEMNLYNELWYVCAGASVYVPRTGERVFYFPQGHLEQVEPFTNEDDIKERMPVYKMPSKILCKVICVQLKADPITDEVFAQITLFPEEKQDELHLDRNSKVLPQKTFSRFISKKLTPSDTSPHGGFSVPKRLAEECLPPLDMSQQPPTQELVAKDLHGNEWNFRHIYRGHPRRHLITSGWGTYLSLKKLVAGDTCIFLRGDNGELWVGVRRAMKLKTYASASVLSCHGMQHGILASASHAVSTGTMFTIYYHPWTSPEFIVPFDQIMKSAEAEYSVGTRFRFPYAVEESVELRVVGTIIGTEDVDSVRWPNSEWNCLKVQWDASPDARKCPERVCPWNIDPMESTKKEPASALPSPKKARPDNATSMDGVLQGQEIRDTSADASTLSLSYGLFHTQVQTQNRLHCPSTIPSHGFYENAVTNRRLFTSNMNFNGIMVQEGRAFKLRDENEATFADSHGGRKCMLFGVNLVDIPMELPSPQVPTPNEQESLCSILSSQSSASDIIQISKNRSCTKVLKHGTAPGRSIDLTRFDGYEELTSELDDMFDFKGSLIDGSSGWCVTYADTVGEMMLVGDSLWQSSSKPKPHFPALCFYVITYESQSIDKFVTVAENSSILLERW